MDVDAYMAERIPRIDAAIEARLAVDAPAGPVPERLRGAMRHLLFPGGKRLRPLFAVAAAEAVGGRVEDALPVAVAVELVHTYSLIHDDLPCMDDDDLRRGRPTVHKAWDEATAVLAGDALLAEAFAVLGGVEDRPGAALDCVHALATAAGAAGLVGGQSDDLAVARLGGIDAERMASIHARKTAALFQAAIVGGACLAGADENDRVALAAFGHDVGIAFQIADDVLDAESGEAASILRVHGVADAKRGAEALLDRALQRIEAFFERAEPLRELARFAVRRDR